LAPNTSLFVFLCLSFAIWLIWLGCMSKTQELGISMCLPLFGVIWEKDYQYEFQDKNRGEETERMRGKKSNCETFDS
jgi:hypothetical protein